jgi:hypothetical protein
MLTDYKKRLLTPSPFIIIAEKKWSGSRATESSWMSHTSSLILMVSVKKAHLFRLLFKKAHLSKITEPKALYTIYMLYEKRLLMQNVREKISFTKTENDS